MQANNDLPGDGNIIIIVHTNCMKGGQATKLRSQLSHCDLLTF